MARPRTMHEVADEIVGLLGVTPSDITDGQLTFTRGDLHSILHIWKDRYDRSVFGWMVTTYDTALHEPMNRFGGMSVRIDHPPPTGEVNPGPVPQAAIYPWPTSGEPLVTQVSTSFEQYGPASLAFIRDRHDLGQLLLADAHTRRGDVWSFTPANNEPARLTQAILLARHAGDIELERAATAKLRSRGEEIVPPRPDYLFRHAVADWAKQYAKATGIDLTDLTKLKGKRPLHGTHARASLPCLLTPALSAASTYPEAGPDR